MAFWNESLNTFAALWLETLVRVCLQGGLALALAWAICRLAPRIPASGKCWLWRLAYLKLLFALLWLPTLDLPLLPALETPSSSAPITPLPAVAPSVAIPSLTSETALPATANSPAIAPVALAPMAVLPTIAGWLLLLWTGTLLWQSGQVVRQSVAVRRLRQSGKPLDGGQLDFWNVALSRELGLPGVPRLLASTATNTPLLIGMFRPCILLPESLLTTCTAEELRLVLAHELAHVRRRDLLWGWLPLLARLICSFHPLVRVAEREISMAQEIACDETALHTTGAASAAYGSLLVRVAACFASHPTQRFGMIGMTESYHTLKRRLSAMKSFPPAPRQYRVAVRFSLLSVGLAALLPWRVAAQAPVPPTPVTPATPPAPVATPAPATPAQAPVIPVTLPAPAAPAQDPVATPAIPRAAGARTLAPVPQADPSIPARASSAPSARTITRKAASRQRDRPTIIITREPKDSRTSITTSRSAITISSALGQKPTVVSVNTFPAASQTVVVNTTATENDNETETASSYPLAAPGRISASHSTSSAQGSVSTASGQRSVTVIAPRGAQEIRVNRGAVTITPSARGRSMRATDPFIYVSPEPKATPTRATDPFQQTTPAPAADPSAPRQRRRINRSSNDPAGVPSVVSPQPASDPGVLPPSAVGIPGVPSALPSATSPKAAPGVPSTPALPEIPDDPGIPTPAVPQATPGKSPLAPATPKTRASQDVQAPDTLNGVPILAKLPILGSLFRTTSSLAAPTRGVLILSDLPILGSLFRIQP